MTAIIKTSITDAKYFKSIGSDDNVGVQATIDGVVSSVPLDSTNIDYAEILKQVADGDITIAEAD